MWLEKNINDCFNRVIQTDADLLVNYIHQIIGNANTRKVVSNCNVSIGLKPATIKNYQIFKNKVLEYEKYLKKQVRFIEITKPFVDKFTNWLVNTKKYSTNYSGRILEALKTLCKVAGENEIDTTAFSKTIQNFRENENDRQIQTLSFHELQVIKNAEFPNDAQLTAISTTQILSELNEWALNPSI